MTDPLQRVVRFERDAAGRVTKQVLPDLREIRASYDANGNVTSILPPSRPAHGFAYTPVDQVESYTPPQVLPASGATTYAYSLDRQLELITRPDGQTIDPAYDAAGRLVSLTTPTGTTSFAFNPTTGHLDSVSAPAGGGTISYQYDGSLVTSLTQAGTVSGTLAYSRDRAADGSSNLWITSHTIDGDSTTRVDYQYDLDGFLTQADALSLHRNSANGLLAGTTLLATGEVYERNSFGEHP